MASDDSASERARARYHSADNLTDRLAALRALGRCDESAFRELLEHFYTQWQREPLAIDKWFAVQARQVVPHAVDRIVSLSEHPAFERRNPDRLRALIETFALENPAAFHAPDGSGYCFVATQILAVDAFNPIVAARLMDCFADWQRYIGPLSSRMRAELLRFVSTAGVSANVIERASTALGSEPTKERTLR
jgi:aminopeptidase N